jgi:excisionase family DNA binding protein
MFRRMRKPQHKNLENFLDLTNAARLYPLSRRTLQMLVYSEKLKAYRVGGKLIVTRSDIEKLLTSVPVAVELNRVVAEVAQEVLSK